MARRNDDYLARLLSGLTVRGILFHSATLFVIGSLVVMGGAIHLWNQYRDDIVNNDQYRLTASKIRLPETDLLDEEQLKNLILASAPDQDHVSLLDTGLVSRTVQTFEKVGWIEHVRSVQKSKAGLDIELAYRNPVAVVELNKNNALNWGQQQGRLFPVDRHGLILPTDVLSRRSLIRLSMFNPAQPERLDSWMPWPDERVRQAASLGHLLQQDWRKLGLYRIVTFRPPEAPADSKEPFELWPDVGTQVIWGSAPGRELEGEASAETKLGLLNEFVNQYGSLGQLPKQKIDVRQGKISTVLNTRTADRRASEWVDENEVKK